MNSIKLEGSSTLDIINFFETSLNCILIQRGLYEEDECETIPKYGENMLVVVDPAVKSYIERFSDQLQDWLEEDLVKSLVVVIKSKETLKTLERWQFDIELDSTEKVDSETTTKQVKAVLRQITASVSFLPDLQEECTFNVLVYTNNDIGVPGTWDDCDPNLIEGNEEQVPLSSFQTSSHQVEASVTFNAS